MIQAPVTELSGYELLASSILNATLLHCTCLYVAITGNALESPIINAVSHFCPMLTYTLGIKPDIQTEISLVVTEKYEDLKQVAKKYSSIIMFYTGHDNIADIDTTQAVLAVTKQHDNYLVFDANDKTLLGQWNHDTKLTSIAESPWLQVIKKARMKRLRAPKIAMFECPPFITYEKRNASDDTVQYDGIELRIVQAALRDFELNLQLVPQNYSISGGSWSKVTRAVASGEADVAVSVLLRLI